MQGILCLLAAALLPAAEAGAREIPAEALGVVRYEIRHVWGALNSKVADATISLEETVRDHQAAYHSAAVIRTQSIFRLFLNAEYTADCYLSRDDLSPLYFINPVKRGGAAGKFEYTYDAGTRTIASDTVLPGKDPEKAVFPLDGRTMDLLTLLQYARFHAFTAADKSLDLHLLMSGKSVAARLTWQGADPDKFPGENAERFLLEMTERGLMENGSGNEIHVWRSAGPDRRILGLEAAISAGTMVVRITE